MDELNPDYSPSLEIIPLITQINAEERNYNPRYLRDIYPCISI